MHGASLYFEDFAVGQEIALGPYEMTEEDIIAFAREFDFQPFHLDKQAAGASVLGSLAASGWHTSSALMRMMCDAVLLKAATLGSTGIRDMKWLKPVFPGDVLTGRMKLTGMRLSASKPNLGIIDFEAHAQDQHGTVKVTLKSMMFVETRGGPS